jgi:hypothetical protein
MAVWYKTVIFEKVRRLPYMAWDNGEETGRPSSMPGRQKHGTACNWGARHTFYAILIPQENTIVRRIEGN